MKTKPFSFRWLLQLLVTLAVVLSQLGAPALALAKQEVDTLAKADQVEAARQILVERAITPEKMARILQNLAKKLPGEGEARRNGERSAALIAADYAAMMSLPAQAARRPFQPEMRLTDAEFPQATPGEVSAALGWLLMGFLNLPASVTDVERQDLGNVLEMGMTALGLHYQVLALRQAMTAVDSASLSVPIELRSPAKASQGVTSTAAPEQTDKKKGIVLQTRHTSKKALQAPAAVGKYVDRRMVDIALQSPVDNEQPVGYRGGSDIWPAQFHPGQTRPYSGPADVAASQQTDPGQPQEARVFGNLRVTANTFVTVDGRVTAVGNVILGASANSINTYRLLGEYDSVVISGTQVTGSGTLAAVQGGTSLFNGSFYADTNQSTPIITPMSGARMLISSMGVFPLQGTASVSSVNLLSGWAEGQAQVLVTPPGITQTIGIRYTLQPGTVFTGTVSDFSLNLSGTNLAVSGALLTNDLIQAAHYMLTLPADLGGNSKQGDLFTLLPKKVILAGSEGAVISLPDIKLDLEGSKVRLENALASLEIGRASCRERV